MRVWQREHKVEIQAEMRNPGYTAQSILSSYSKASAKLWNNLDPDLKHEYELLAKELNAGTATEEEKRA